MKRIYPDKRSWLITRSTFPGAGRHGGHWTGDNLSTWQELKNSIPAVLENNMFGIPYSGADVCGFNENADEDLCTTWTLLGITYPLMRNHNARGATEQDPASWSQRHSDIIIPAIHLRYSLLPELHNQFWLSHNNGKFGEIYLRVYWGERLFQVIFNDLNERIRSALSIDTKFGLIFLH